MNKNIVFLFLALCSATALRGMEPQEPASVRLSRWICKHPAIVAFVSTAAGAGAGYTVERMRDSKHTIAYPVGSGTAGLLLSGFIMNQASYRVSRADREYFSVYLWTHDKARHFPQGFRDWQAFMLPQLNPQSSDFIRIKSIENYAQMTPTEQLIAARELQLHPAYSDSRTHNGEYLRRYIQGLVKEASK